MDDEHAIEIVSSPSAYSDDLARSGAAANYYARQGIFADYHEQTAHNTKARQKNDLLLFSTMLAEMGVNRSVDALYHDALAWEGIDYGHLKAFQKWLRNQGYAISSINVSVTTIRRYCGLAYETGVLSHEAIDMIQTVKSYNRKVGQNIDASREQTRKGHKKAAPAYVPSMALQQLRTTTTTPAPSRRNHDRSLAARDQLLVCLFTEHGLRCSEIVNLDIEHFNLETREITVHREKTGDTETYELLPRAYEALRLYLAEVSRKSGPLFTGYQGKRISRRGVNKRIGELGGQVHIEHLSPHDLRHDWTKRAIRENSLDVVQVYGGWKSSAMPLHYAKTYGVTHKGLKLSE
jgi:integrase